MNRLLAAGTTGYIIAVLICIECGRKTSFSCFVILALLLILSLIATFFRKHTFFPVSVILIFTLLSFSLFLFTHTNRVEKARAFDGYNGKVTGQITELYTNKFYSELKINNITIGNDRIKTHILVNLSTGALNLKEGDYVILDGKLNTDFVSFFGTTDEKHLASQDVFLLMDANGVEKAAIKPNKFRNLVYNYRQKLISETSSLKHNGFITALTLGDKSNLDIEIQEDFQKLGLQHSLAVSGMHLSLLVMSLYVFLQKYSVGKYPLSVICSLITVFYMALTGFSFSILRAGIMMIIYFLSLLARRPNDSITTLFTSALLILILNPWAVFDIGFQLSFFATLGILIFAKPIIEKLEVGKLFTFQLPERRISRISVKLLRNSLKTILITFAVTISATLTTIPLILIHFNSITPFSFIANITVIFLINILLVTSVIYTILSPVLIYQLDIALIFICNILSDTTLSITSRLADKLPSPLYFPPETAESIATACGIILLFYFLFYKNHKTALYATLSFILVITITLKIVTTANKNTAYITFSTSGTCNDTLIETSEGKTLLSVVGKDNSKTAEYSIINYRKAYLLDTVILFSDNARPSEKLEVLLEISKIKKLILVQINGTLGSKEKAKIDELCDGEIEYVRAREFTPDNAVTIKKFGKKYITVTISEGDNDTVIVYSLDGQSAPPRIQLENVEGVVLIGDLYTCPRYEEKHFYLCSLPKKVIRRKGTSNKDKFNFGFIKISDKKLKYNIY